MYKKIIVIVLGFFILNIFSINAYYDNYLGKKLYIDKKYDESIGYFNKAGNVEGYYNVANSLYKQKKYSDAIKEYKSILKSEKNEINFNINYNIGNSFYRVGELENDNTKKIKNWEEAIKYYTDALNIKYDDNAKKNLEFVLDKIKKQKENKAQDKKDNSGKDGDKKDSSENKDGKSGSDGKKSDNEKGNSKKDSNTGDSKDNTNGNEKKDNGGKGGDKNNKKDSSENKDGKSGSNGEKTDNKKGNSGDSSQKQESDKQKENNELTNKQQQLLKQYEDSLKNEQKNNANNFNKVYQENNSNDPFANFFNDPFFNNDLLNGGSNEKDW